MPKKHITESLAGLYERFAPPDEQQFHSLGSLCQSLNITPGQLGVLMEAAGVRFDESRDGVLYANGRTTQAILDEFNRVTAEIETARASAASN